MAWNDLIDQQHVTDILQRAVESGRVPHAYLFYGPDGVGKRATALDVIEHNDDDLAILADSYRILKPGGRIQVSDIVLTKPVGAKSKANAQLWAECGVGAEPVNDYLDIVREAGFKDVVVIDRLDYFDRSSNENTKQSAKSLGAHTIVLTGRKE